MNRLDTILHQLNINIAQLEADADLQVMPEVLDDDAEANNLIRCE